MFALAESDTVRLLRALSLGGPATTCELAARLAVRPLIVQQVIDQGLVIGVVRPLADGVGRYEIDPVVVAAAVAQHRDALLGRTS